MGLRAYKKRIAGFAGAAFATILGLFSVSFGQKDGKDAVPTKAVINRTFTNSSVRKISGIVTDVYGAVIPGAKVRLKASSGKKNTVETDDKGTFSISQLAEEKYSIEISSPGFRKLVVENVSLTTGEDLSLNLIMQVAGESVTIGIYAEEPLIDMRSSSVTTTITRRQIETLPY